MGWIIAIALFIISLFNASEISHDAVLIASGLFAIAGSIGLMVPGLKDIFKKKE